MYLHKNIFKLYHICDINGQQKHKWTTKDTNGQQKDTNGRQKDTNGQKVIDTNGQKVIDGQKKILLLFGCLYYINF